MNSVLETAIAFWKSAALFSALKVGLFEKLGENPLPADEIAQRCGLNPDSTSRLLRALSSMGMLKRDGELYYCAEPALDSLIPGREKNLTNFCRILGEDFNMGIWANIGSPEKSLQPVPIDETAYALPDKALAEQNLAQLGETEALKNAMDLKNALSLLDLGGGTGAYTIALCGRNPHLQALIVEKPEIAPLTMKIIAENEFDDRIHVMAKDWKDISFKEEFDVVLLSDVLYLPNFECEKLLDIAASALKKDGLIVIRGSFLSDTDDSLFPALFDINLLLHNNKFRNKTVSEIQSWLEKRGLADIKSQLLSELSTLITGKKTS